MATVPAEWDPGVSGTVRRTNRQAADQAAQRAVRQAARWAADLWSRFRCRPALREIALLVAGYVAYSAGRLLAGDDVEAARQRARAILHVEQVLHIAVESSSSGWLASSVTVSPVPAVMASLYYASLHYLLTPAALVLLWRIRPQRYRELRNVLFGASLPALACYILLPVAPPRLSGGAPDVLALTSRWGWWSAHASAPKGLSGLTDELAAMPSMHVGWAVWVAVAVFVLTANRWLRALAVLYPVTTSVVVIATGNHWVLDVAAGAALTLAVLAVDRVVLPRLRSARAERDLEPERDPEPQPTT